MRYQNVGNEFQFTIKKNKYVQSYLKTLLMSEITQAALIAEQDKIVKLETYDLSLFNGQSYFNDDGSQNY